MWADSDVWSSWCCHFFWREYSRAFVFIPYYNQSSQSLIISLLPVPSHPTLLYLLPLSVLNAMPVCLSPSSTAGVLALMMAHGEPYHAVSYTALFLGRTGSNWRYAGIATVVIIKKVIIRFFNPYLTRLSYKGGCCNPHRYSIIRVLWYYIWYLCIGLGSLYPYQPKINKKVTWRLYDVIVIYVKMVKKRKKMPNFVCLFLFCFVFLLLLLLFCFVLFYFVLFCFFVFVFVFLYDRKEWGKHVLRSFQEKVDTFKSGRKIP